MKFYKILNEEEKHFKMKYKTGLNEDILPFNPSGDCKLGGIYFSREDILYFLSYGSWIREVTIPKNEEIYENPGIPKKWKAHRVILGERKRINLDVIKQLHKDGVNIHVEDDYPLSWACEKGHLDIVKYLIENGADVDAYSYDPLYQAVSHKRINVVKYLIENGATITDEILEIEPDINPKSEIYKYLKKKEKEQNNR